MKNCLVIFNPTAGPRRLRRLRDVLGLLRARGVEVTVCETFAPRDGERIAREARGYHVIVAAGGDGTINEVLNGIHARGDGCILGVVPLGTANVLARELGIDARSTEAIVNAVMAQTPRMVSLGLANGRGFSMMAGVGFDAHVVANVDTRVKRVIGKFAYVAESLMQLVRYRARTYLVEIDGRTETASSVVVANGHFYGGSYVIAPQASLDDHQFQVCLFRRTGRWNAVRYMWGLISGRLARFPDLDIIPARQLRVIAGDLCATDEPVQGDGDIMTTLPVELEVSAAGLPVMRPA